MLAHDDFWPREGFQLEFVMECQILANILNGAAAVDDGPHVEIIRAIFDRIDNLLLNGWTPRYRVLPLVRWRAREFNGLADALANASMKFKRDLK